MRCLPDEPRFRRNVAALWAALVPAVVGLECSASGHRSHGAADKVARGRGERGSGRHGAGDGAGSQWLGRAGAAPGGFHEVFRVDETSWAGELPVSMAALGPKGKLWATADSGMVLLGGPKGPKRSLELSGSAGAKELKFSSDGRALLAAPYVVDLKTWSARSLLEPAPEEKSLFGSVPVEVTGRHSGYELADASLSADGYSLALLFRYRPPRRGWHQAAPLDGRRTLVYFCRSGACRRIDGVSRPGVSFLKAGRRYVLCGDVLVDWAGRRVCRLPGPLAVRLAGFASWHGSGHLFGHRIGSGFGGRPQEVVFVPVPACRAADTRLVIKAPGIAGLAWNGAGLLAVATDDGQVLVYGADGRLSVRRRVAERLTAVAMVGWRLLAAGYDSKGRRFVALLELTGAGR